MQILNDFMRLFIGTHVAQTRESGEGCLIQPRDYDGKMQLVSAGMSRIALQPKLLRYILDSGDVLLASKGRHTFAVVYRGYAEPVVPSSSFSVLRINDVNQLRPDYLCWYLNLSRTRLSLQGIAKGTSMPSISISELAGLPITVPDMETQQRIIHAMDLHAKRSVLSNRLQELNLNFLQAQLLQLAKQRS